MLVRDESGAIRTDIEVTSAEGIIYPLLTAPITNAPPPTSSGPFILSPVAVSESGLGTPSVDAALENIINHSGLGKPMVSGSSLFDDYIFDGDRPTANPDYRGYWQSEVSFDGTFNGALDFDLGDHYVVDRLALWNGTLAFEYAILRELALSVSPLPDSEGAFLSLSMDGASLLVTWPAVAIGFQLQSATTLADGGDWRDIDESPDLQGDQHAASVDRESAGTRFFRLRKP
jgi:hypothetical protein